MALHPSFIRIDISSAMQAEARYHALLRTKNIKRQFVPKDAPLSAIESNYIGALGEIVLHSLIYDSLILGENYTQGKVDSGDIRIQNLMYDIKSEAVPMQYFKNLYAGMIQPFETYGCRVWTAAHKHHLVKYTGGVIFVAFPVPDQAREDQRDGLLRDSIIQFCTPALITGYVTPQDFTNLKPQQYSPPNPQTGHRHRYYSANYIFHHTQLRPLTEII